MYSVYFLAYVAFLSIIFVAMTLVSLFAGSRRKYSTSKNYRPKVLVVMPCKGTDIDLEGNIAAAQSQSYRNYALVAVVDTKSDPALAAIKRRKAEFIISDRGCGNCSGKVRAIASAFKRYKANVYVILDSDVLVKSDWLERLIAPLYDKNIGISTAFPVFLPKGGFWSKVKHAWGYVGFGLMESEITRFGWGGSLAFRRELLDAEYYSYFSESISDDVALTNIAKRVGLRVAYVPESNPIVYVNDNFSQFMEWSTRQAVFSIAGNRRIFYYGLIFYLAGIILLLSGIVLGVFANVVFLVFLVPFLIGAAKSYSLSKSPHVLAIYPFLNFIYLFNLVRARGMESVKWRGSVYNVKNIKKTEI